MRGSADFDVLVAYRGFIDEIVGRQNARHAKLIEAERARLLKQPDRRSSDDEEASVRVTSSGGFTLHEVFDARRGRPMCANCDCEGRT